jgi:hypothetical protein
VSFSSTPPVRFLYGDFGAIVSGGKPRAAENHGRSLNREDIE